ncbi:MAG: argininosuccinate lyase, partial [Oscillospiraceae bacterium]|nr:argininosuccinate lyase [Oscillospiraceae bacterium]
MPFRDAYTVTGALVYHCTQSGKTLEELTLDELKEISPLFGEDVYEALNMLNCAFQRKSFGGPAKEETTRQIEYIKAFIAARS